MNIRRLKHLLLAALNFVFFCSGIQCMQAPERNDDFEAALKRGYYDFLDKVGKEIGSNLTESPIEKGQAVAIPKNIEPVPQQAGRSNKAQEECISSEEAEARVESIPDLPLRQEKEAQEQAQELKSKEGSSTILSEFMSAMLEFNIKIMEDRGKSEAPHSLMKKQFELYKQFTGNNHPLELEANKQRIEVQDVLQKVVDKEEAIQKSPEIDQKEEKVALWTSEIDTILGHIKVLGNYQLTYRELLNTLETMKIYYNHKTQEQLATNDLPGLVAKKVLNLERHQENFHSYTTCLQRLERAISQTTWKVNTDRRGLSRFDSPHGESDYCCEFIFEELKDVIKTKMEKYKELKGNAHPRWDEFSRM